MKAVLQRYQTRMQRALDHVDQHLFEALDLDTISAVAAFSKYHFHRQFSAIFGLPLHRYVQLARMKHASYRLAYRTAESVTDIALDAGYGAPDAFSRAFRQRFGQSPSSFRNSPDWESWHSALGPLHDARSTLLLTIYTPEDVKIRQVVATPVAVLAHRGDPAMIGNTIRRFIAWRKAVGLVPKASATFNIFHSDPASTTAADYRLDLCASTDRPIKPNSEGIEPGEIPGGGGRVAVLRVTGNTDNLEAAALYLYRDWLPVSGEEARDFPLYCQRVAFFPDVPEHEAIAELLLPLK